MEGDGFQSIVNGVELIIKAKWVLEYGNIGATGF